MTNWFECKVKYDKVDVNSGKQRTVNELYLIDAVSFTEAETRINKELEPYISGEFHVTNIKRSNFSELIPDEAGDRWYKCKVTYISIDEEKGVERKTNTYMLVQANDVKEAYDNVEKSFNGMTTDYEIPVVQESPILDVFPYTAEDGEEEVEEEIEEDTTPEPEDDSNLTVTYNADEEEEVEDEENEESKDKEE